VRSDSTLDNELERVSTSTSQPTTTSVEYSGSFTVDGQNKVAIFADTGDMISIARLSDTVDGGGTGTFTIGVDDGTNSDKAVATTTAQEATANILANTSVTTTDQYTYGDTSNASIAESDTALTSLVAINDITNVTLQSASTNSEFEAITTIDSTAPFVVQNNALELAQTAFTFEAETTVAGNTTNNADRYSDGTAVVYEDGGGSVGSFTFDLDYDVPDGNAKIALRLQNDSAVSGKLIFDNNLVTRIFADSGIEWSSFSISGGVAAGTHEIELDSDLGSIEAGEVGLQIDLVAFYDDRFYDITTWDNTVNVNGGYLNDPELYPDAETQAFDTATSLVKLDSAKVVETLNDTTNNQAFTIGSDGLTFNNTDTGEVFYALQRVVELVVSNTLGAYTPGGTAQSATPRFGYDGQRVEDYTLTADLRAVQRNNIGEVVVRTVVDDTIAAGNTFADAGQTDGTDLLTHVRLPEFVKESNQKVISNEKLRWVND
jgi:hypothetical protein